MAQNYEMWGKESLSSFDDNHKTMKHRDKRTNTVFTQVTAVSAALDIDF